ncbi:MAG: PfkB family carbohydrate kinase, partial [Bryobacteraceae bacterium]
ENTIVISPGANADVSVDFALQALEKLQAGDLLLCQLEIPMETVEAAIETAHRRRITTVLDPAPASCLPDSLLDSIDILTPNQTEAAILIGASEPPREMAEAEQCAQELRRRGAHTVIVTMGNQGCLIVDGTVSTAVPGFQVQVSDTTAAGDTFNGALAAALAQEVPLAGAAVFANAAAALSVTKPGALSSIPAASDVNKFLDSVEVTS